MVLTAGLLLPLLGAGQWGLSAPAGGEAFALFASSMVLDVALAAAISTIMDVLVVATLSERGVNTFVGPLTIIFSGSLIPLPLLPDWLQPVLRYQPFAGLLDFPLRMYSGHMGGWSAVAALVRQAVWIVVLIVVGKIAMARVMARVEAQGG
jgi:ABC-2 type transport system permease protein